MPAGLLSPSCARSSALPPSGNHLRHPVGTPFPIAPCRRLSQGRRRSGTPSNPGDAATDSTAERRQVLPQRRPDRIGAKRGALQGNLIEGIVRPLVRSLAIEELVRKVGLGLGRKHRVHLGHSLQMLYCLRNPRLGPSANQSSPGATSRHFCDDDFLDDRDVRKCRGHHKGSDHRVEGHPMGMSLAAPKGVTR